MTTSPRPGLQERAEDVAIVGMSCLFPGADTPARFWQNIVGKVDAICDAPPDWQPEIFYDPAGPAIDRSYTRRGGFLGDLCRFHPPKYGVPPVAVDGAEPDQFVALRCASEALWDAGFPEIPINRAKTGVIMGRGIFVNRGWVTVFQRTLAAEQVIGLLQQLEPHRSEEDLEKIRRELKRNLPPANADTFPGLCHSALVGRIANRFDLNGPAYTVDAACSSTLLAVEHALRELRAGRCDAMLVGGTQVSAPAQIHIMFCHLQALSREGQIAPFSAQAEGTVLGQGCGMMVLKRRSDAERDGNRIYAVLKSAGVSSDGNGAGLLAPRTEGQQLSIRRAYEEYDISPDTVQLVEAHGTGIPLGDAVEINSLKSCFGPQQRNHPDVALGSVKSMVGHLVPASGAVSLIKTALALYHRVLPPTLHAETPNPALELDKTRFYLCTQPRPWIHGNPAIPRRAGVNAFGFGGINAHVVMEEHCGDESRGQDLEREWPCELVVVSADDRADLAQRVQSLSAWLQASSGCTLLDVAASCARLPGNCRLAVVAKSLPDLIKKLDQAAPLLADPARQRIQDRGGVFWHAQPLAAEGKVALVFPGEGSQYPNMLGELCRHFPEVRREFDLTSRALELKGESLARVLFSQPATEKAAEQELFRMDLAVASVTAAARGLWRLLQTLGIEADAVVGHSSGEYAALLAAGAYGQVDDEALLRAILAGIDSAVELKAANVLPPSVLISVGGVPDDTLNAVLAETSDEVAVAIDNCPHQRILVGAEEPMSRLLAKLQGKGGLCQRLAWDRPYHTEAFGPACPIVERYFDSLALCAPQIDLWSCATAAPMPRDAGGVRELAVRQWRSKVRFRETIDAMYQAGTRVFIECGPRGNLSAFVGDTLGKRPHAAVPLDVPNKSGVEQLCRALGTLAAHGVPMRLDELYRRRNPRYLALDGEPVQAAKVEPVLPLELPLLCMSDAVVQGWQAGATKNMTPPLPAPVQHQPAVTQQQAVPQQQAVRRAMESPAASEPVQPAAAPVRNETLLPANGHRELPVSARQAAHQEFQQTMQQFLRTQVAVAELRGPSALGADLDRSFSQGNSITATVAPPSAQATMIREPVRVRPAETPPAPPTGLKQKPRHYPFIESLLEHRPGERLVFECEWNVDKHRFLRDHTFFGGRASAQATGLIPLPVMPLAMSLEVMAEAAAMLCPELVVTALARIRVAGWLPFPGKTRRVRAIAQCVSDTLVDVRLVEADGDSDYEIVAAQVEMGNLPQTLGSGRLPAANNGPPPWLAEGIYERILYHGPAFQGIETVDDWGADNIRARVRQPDPTILVDGLQAAELVLPVALIDTASQMPGLVYCDVDSARDCRTFAFPNEIERLEFGRAAFGPGAMTAISTLEQSPGRLLSDTEITLPDGQAVLRYLGKSDEAVDVPLALYCYGRSPRESLPPQSLNELFAATPGIERVAIRAANLTGQRLLAKAHWARVLAYMILDQAERDEFNRLKLPPVALADWLLGRMAAKEAVRAVMGHSDYLADTRIANDEQGRPRAFVQGRETAAVSLAHKTFCGIAVAARTGDFQGIGIDCEPLQPLPAEVRADAFVADELKLLDAAAASSGQSLDAWHRAAWGAKEAVGKALGRGVLGGPRNVLIQDVDPRAQRLALVLRGSMADQFPQYRTGQGQPLQAVWREHGGQVVALCLI